MMYKDTSRRPDFISERANGRGARESRATKSDLRHQRDAALERAERAEAECAEMKRALVEYATTHKAHYENHMRESTYDAADRAVHRVLDLGRRLRDAGGGDV